MFSPGIMGCDGYMAIMCPVIGSLLQKHGSGDRGLGIVLTDGLLKISSPYCFSQSSSFSYCCAVSFVSFLFTFPFAINKID